MKQQTTQVMTGGKRDKYLLKVISILNTVLLFYAYMSVFVSAFSFYVEIAISNCLLLFCIKHQSVFYNCNCFYRSFTTVTALTGF